MQIPALLRSIISLSQILAVTALPPILPRPDNPTHPIEILGCHDTDRCCHGYFRNVRVRADHDLRFNELFAMSANAVAMNRYTAFFDCIDLRRHATLARMGEAVRRGPYKLRCTKGRRVLIRRRPVRQRPGEPVASHRRMAECEFDDLSFWDDFWLRTPSSESNAYPIMRIDELDTGLKVWINRGGLPRSSGYRATPELVCPIDDYQEGQVTGTIETDEQSYEVLGPDSWCDLIGTLTGDEVINLCAKTDSGCKSVQVSMMASDLVLSSQVSVNG